MPKATTPKSDRQGRRHNPLEDDVLATGILRQKAPKRKSKDTDEDGQHFIDDKPSRKILQLGRELAEEDQGASFSAENPHDAFAISSRFDLEGGRDDDAEVFEDEEAWVDGDEEVEDIEIDAEDLETFNKFLPSEQDQDPLLKHGWDGFAKAPEDQAQSSGLNLADLILAKIAAYESGMDQKADVAAPDDFELPPKVVEVYSKVGLILSRYKSGKLPKVIKILPTLPHWEQIILLSEPETWSPNAVYEVTRVFASSRPAIAQRFYEMVLLDAVRDDIREHKKLNVHLFNALKKAFYKPSAWFKGILFPLCASGTATLREANILSGVITRTSVPVLHSAAAIKGLCDIGAQEASAGTEGGGATNLFIKALLDKRYALPYQVIDTLVFHFLRIRGDVPATKEEGETPNRTLPVIFHQTLLKFAERYKNEITEDQREALLDLLLTHGHPAIGPDVRRELLAGRGRGVPIEPQGPAFDGDDTSM